MRCKIQYWLVVLFILTKTNLKLMVDVSQMVFQMWLSKTVSKIYCYLFGITYCNLCKYWYFNRIDILHNIENWTFANKLSNFWWKSLLVPNKASEFWLIMMCCLPKKHFAKLLMCCLPKKHFAKLSIMDNNWHRWSNFILGISCMCPTGQNYSLELMFAKN